MEDGEGKRPIEAESKPGVRDHDEPKDARLLSVSNAVASASTMHANPSVIQRLLEEERYRQMLDLLEPSAIAAGQAFNPTVQQQLLSQQSLAIASLRHSLLEQALQRERLLELVSLQNMIPSQSVALQQYSLQQGMPELGPVGLSLPVPAAAAPAGSSPSRQPAPSQPPQLRTSVAFPENLHQLLRDCEDRNQTHIISFNPDGDSFQVHDPDAFASDIAPLYFKSRNFLSFKRQLYLYGFTNFRNPGEKQSSGFAHPHFHRDHPEWLPSIRRTYKTTKENK